MKKKSQICKRQRRMKRIILAALGSALLLPSQAQQKNKEYTKLQRFCIFNQRSSSGNQLQTQDRCFETGCSGKVHSYFNQLHYFRNA